MKRQALEQLPAIFARTQASRQHSDPEKDAVSRQIGRLKVELDALKKESAGRMEDKRRRVDRFHCELSIQRQYQLLGLARRSHCYHPRPKSEGTLALPRRLGELYMERPSFGSRRMAAMLGLNRRRMQRLMRIAGIEALYPKPRLSPP